jgi:UDP-glucose 4-epimerase
MNQNKLFDFIYIDDLVTIVSWFISNQPQENVYNVCSGKVIDFKTLAEMIVKLSNKRLKIVIKADGLGREYSGDNSLLLKELKGFKFSPIDDSVKQLYNWYDLNKQILEDKI